MKSISLYKYFFAIIAAASLLLSGCSFFPESSFELAPQSRLPQWFTLPAGLSRSEVTVTMDYYITSSGRSAAFTLKDAKKYKLSQMKGNQLSLEPMELKNPPSGFPPGYPAYEIITVNGITEIIEHRRMEPIFYICDDPKVRAELISNDSLNDPTVKPNE